MDLYLDSCDLLHAFTWVLLFLYVTSSSPLLQGVFCKAFPFIVLRFLLHLPDPVLFAGAAVRLPLPALSAIQACKWLQKPWSQALILESSTIPCIQGDNLPVFAEDLPPIELRHTHYTLIYFAEKSPSNREG